MGKQPRKQSRNQGRKKTTASANQTSAEQASQEIVHKVKFVTAVAPLSDAAKAANIEYERIEQQIGPASHNPDIIVTTGCDKEPEWCVPDVACVARVTLTQEGRNAFEAHRAKCQQTAVKSRR